MQQHDGLQCPVTGVEEFKSVGKSESASLGNERDNSIEKK